MWRSVPGDVLCSSSSFVVTSCSSFRKSRIVVQLLHVFLHTETASYKFYTKATHCCFAVEPSMKIFPTKKRTISSHSKPPWDIGTTIQADLWCCWTAAERMKRTGIHRSRFLSWYVATANRFKHFSHPHI